MTIDHPIFIESLKYIRSRLHYPEINPLEKQVLERLIHTSGDFSIQNDLRFSPNACQLAISALKNGAPILTDTLMAAAAVTPMASRTLKTKVFCILDWAPAYDCLEKTKSSIGIEKAWNDLSKKFSGNNSPLVLFGSAPTALEGLVNLISQGANRPSLIIGMPVGFINVLESKSLLAKSDLPQIRIDGNRGGAALAAATVNSLLRSSVLSN